MISLEVRGNLRRRWKPKKTWIEKVKALNLIDKVVLDRIGSNIN